MRTLLILVTLLLIVLVFMYLRRRKNRDFSGGFKETDKAGTRIRALKYSLESTWDSRGIMKRFDPILISKTRGSTVDRVSYKTTPKEVFQEKYLFTNTPCLITNMADDWKAMNTWSFDSFKKRFGNCKFSISGIEACRLKYDYYYHYINTPKHRNDDIPLFIFDSTFANEGKKMRELLDEYTIPSWFDEDLFGCLEERERPNFRWLIMSTVGAGTSLHVDPVHTSAWNTLISGKKRWVMFPPETFKSEMDFNSGVRGAEWFMDEYSTYDDLKHVDIIQNRGDTIFLPSGWWHVTVNLEDSIAITQNILTHNNFEKAREDVFRCIPKIYIEWIKRLNKKLKDDKKLTMKLGGRIRDTKTIEDAGYDSDVYESESDLE